MANCNYQCFFISGAELSGGNVLFSLSGTPTLKDKAQIVLRFNRNIAIPAGATDSTLVYITVDGVSYPWLNRFGNQMTVGELLKTNNCQYFCPRFNYLNYFGLSTPAHFIAHNFPLKTCSYYVV